MQFWRENYFLTWLVGKYRREEAFPNFPVFSLLYVKVHKCFLWHYFHEKNSTGDTCAFVLSTSKIKVSRYFFTYHSIYIISTKMWLYDNWLNYLVLTEKSYCQFLYISVPSKVKSFVFRNSYQNLLLLFEVSNSRKNSTTEKECYSYLFFRHNRQSNLLQILNLTGKILLVRCYESVNSLHKMILLIYAFSECFFLV